MVGHFKYGSEQVNVVADATIPGGLGTFGYDDEGDRAQRVPIISGGILVNLLTSRETAHLSRKRKQRDDEGRWLESDSPDPDDQYQSGAWRMDPGTDDRGYGRRAFS